MDNGPIATALQGCLERHADGWYWRDGIYEPRVGDVTFEGRLRDWPQVERDDGMYVGVPHDFRGRIPPGETVLVGLIDQLVREHGVAAAVPAPDLDEHGLQRHGWLVPLENWHGELARPRGAKWNMDDEPQLLERANALGYAPHSDHHRMSERDTGDRGR